MNAFAGTAALTRLALRLDRVRLPVWVLVIAALPAGTAAQYKELYPDDAAIAQVGGVVANPSLVALNGPLFQPTLGGLTTWKILVTEIVLVGLMSLLTVVRHTRTEEETGRLELLRAAVVGRYAPLTAALLTAVIANLVAGVLLALGLLGVGLSASGALAMALAIGGTGIMFASVAAVTAQLTTSARAATGLAAVVLGATYLLRAVGDTGPTWVSWLSPVGWAMRLRPYAGEQWWALIPAAGFVVVLLAVAYTLVGRRDVGAGLLPDRPGPADAATTLRSPFALAWRLHRGILAGWVVAMAVAGAVLGGAAKGISSGFAPNEKMTELLARLGGTGALANAYLGAVIGITGLTVGVYTVQATLRMRAEETSGRLEPLLATAVGRTRWALSHLVFALLGTALILAVSGLAAGLAYGVQLHDVGGQAGRLLGAALVQVPAAWVLAGFGVALFGLAPRLAALAWAGLVACVLVLEVGALLGLSQWVLDVSPFAHVPKLPGSAFTATPLVWLAVVAAALLAAGLVGFRRRDLAG